VYPVPGFTERVLALYPPAPPPPAYPVDPAPPPATTRYVTEEGATGATGVTELDAELAALETPLAAFALTVNV
jgi:hypothetical protein